MARNVIWAAVAVAAFLLGYLLGGQDVRRVSPAGDTFATFAADRAAGTGARGVVAAHGRPQPVHGTRDIAGADAAGDANWPARLEQLDALVRSGDPAAADALRARLLESVRRQARDGEVDTAERRLAAYLARNPHDPEAYLLEADLEQMQGRGEAALPPLLDLLAFADDPAVVQRARDKLQLFVGVREAQLANTGDTDALIRLFESLTLRDPTFDGHRLRLVHWLLRAGRADDAADVLAQTGTAGIDPAVREELAARVRLARTGLPVERQGSALHVAATVGGRPMRLLVDTGATTTVISRAEARTLGAMPTGERVRVHTAAGIVESELHRLEDVRIGDVHVDSLPVIVLDGPLPRGVDGLLGMDVLARFQNLSDTGLPMSAEP